MFTINNKTNERKIRNALIEAISKGHTHFYLKKDKAHGGFISMGFMSSPAIMGGVLATGFKNTYSSLHRNLPIVV